MAKLECKSSQKGVPSKWVTVEGVTDAQVHAFRALLDGHLEHGQPSTAVATAFVNLVETCPTANPSDLWHHVLYRHLLEDGWNDQKWKRVSGFALERALVKVFSPRLEQHGVRMRIVPAREADVFLQAIGTEIRSTKVDLFLEGREEDTWHVFGAAHVKSSIAERIQDDVPASLAFQKRRLMSIAITMDAKSYPPPHGECINYGELGGRSADKEKARIKRSYIEESGQFDGLFSFNLRTPPSKGQTNSGRRIYTMGFHDPQPDQLTDFIVKRWAGRHA